MSKTEDKVLTLRFMLDEGQDAREIVAGIIEELDGEVLADSANKNVKLPRNKNAWCMTISGDDVVTCRVHGRMVSVTVMQSPEDDDDRAASWYGGMARVVGQTCAPHAALVSEAYSCEVLGDGGRRLVGETVGGHTGYVLEELSVGKAYEPIHELLGDVRVQYDLRVARRAHNEEARAEINFRSGHASPDDACAAVYILEGTCHEVITMNKHGND